MLEVGTKAPEFTLPDQNGQVHSLADYQGKKVILYFYPKDMTGGCTAQACNTTLSCQTNRGWSYGKGRGRLSEHWR